MLEHLPLRATLLTLLAVGVGISASLRRRADRAGGVVCPVRPTPLSSPRHSASPDWPSTERCCSGWRIPR